MTEIILNAVINLFAVQASCLPENRRGIVKDSLEFYLRSHLKIWNIDDYSSLYQEALSIQELNQQARKVDLAKNISSRIASKMPLLDQYSFLAYYLYPASLVSDSQEAESTVTAVMDSLNVNRDEAESMRLLYSFSVSSTTDSSGLIVKNDTGLPKADEISAQNLIRPDFAGSFSALFLKDVQVMFISAWEGPSISLDSQPLYPGRPQLLKSGAILNDSRGNRIYSGELLSIVKAKGQGKESRQLYFQGRNINFR
ncbi:MAG: hypothetical protein ABR542_04585, partial [Desulfonatronovibrio sp.]